MRRTACRVAMAAAFLLLAGCSGLCVGHLDPGPWAVNATRAMDTRFWRFLYVAEPMRDGFGLRGTARMKPEELPGDMAWIEALRFVAYLSDARGEVVARAEEEYPPRPLAADDPCGVPFNFVLHPDTPVSAPLYVSFGYTMALAPGRLSRPDSRPFFAMEGAVEH